MINQNIRVPGSYNEVDASGANTALPTYRQPILIVAPRIKPPAAWSATTPYQLGAVVKPSANSNNYYICIVAGSSSATEPAWPGAGGVVTDGGATWREFVSVVDLVAVNTPVKCYSADDAARYAGSGSIAHRMVRAVFRQYKYAEVTLICVDDADASVKATASLVFSGAATSSGTIDIYIGKDKISYSYLTGATAASIAQEVDALIAAAHDLPVTSDVSTSTITLRAKNGGTPGNELGLWSPTNSKYEPVVIKTSDDGITVAVTGFSSGATDPDLSSAFTAATVGNFALVAIPYKGSDQLSALKEYLRTVSDEVNCNGARAFIATTKSIADATTLADQNYERLHVALVRRCKMPSYEIAAAVAADHAATGHPAIPLNNRPLYDCDAPAIANRLEFNEINSLLWNGVTPYNADQTGVVRCVRSITTYTYNASGTPDDLYLDTTTIANLDYTRQSIKSRHEREFQGCALRDNHVDGEPDFIVTPDDIRSVNIDVCLRLEQFGCLQNVKALKDRFVSQRDPNIQGRVNSDIPVEVVHGLHVLANTIRIVTTN